MSEASGRPSGVENSPLLAAIERDVRFGDWPSRENLYRVFLESILLLPLNEMPTGVDPSTGKVKAPIAVRFRTGRTPAGEKWTAVFTDEEALRRYVKTGCPFARIPARSIFKLMLESNVDQIFVNPFDEEMVRPGGFLTRQEFEMLASGIVPQKIGDHHAEIVINADTQPNIERPTSRLPDAVIDALRSAAEPLSGLTKIYHLRLTFTGGLPHDALGLRCGVGPSSLRSEEVATRVMDSIHPLLGEHDALDLIPVESDEKEAAFQQGHLIWERDSSI